MVDVLNNIEKEENFLKKLIIISLKMFKSRSGMENNESYQEIWLSLINWKNKLKIKIKNLLIYNFQLLSLELLIKPCHKVYYKRFAGFWGTWELASHKQFS